LLKVVYYLEVQQTTAHKQQKTNQQNKMTTSKKATASKVHNSKVSFKNGKNEKAESLMKRAFEPKLSAKDNKARLTFCGVEHSIIEWTKDGKKHEKPVMKLAFSCLDITHESPQVLAVTCDYRLSSNNRLGQILTIMGFNFTDEVEIIDDEDEFGTKAKQINPTEIFDFLRGQCGLVFKAGLETASRKNKTTGEKYKAYGLWEIAYKTLEPMVKDGVQLRDMMANDVTDEDFVNPDIDMASESD
jgi:hypothetical protein